MSDYIPDDDLLPWRCSICDGPLYEREAVSVRYGMAHEDCAIARFGQDDDNRDPGIPKPGM